MMLLLGLIAFTAAWFSPGPEVLYTIRVDRTDLSGYTMSMRFTGAPDTFTVAMAAHPEYDDKYWRYVEGLRIDTPVGRHHARGQRALARARAGRRGDHHLADQAAAGGAAARSGMAAVRGQHRRPRRRSPFVHVHHQRHPLTGAADPRPARRAGSLPPVSPRPPIRAPSRRLRSMSWWKGP